MNGPFFAQRLLKLDCRKSKIKKLSGFDIESVNVGPWNQMGVFLCIECGKSFEEEAFLFIHQNKTHDKTVRSCEKCGESFVGKVALQNHKRKHNNAVAKMKAMMKCEICPYETSNLANLRSCAL